MIPAILAQAAPAAPELPPIKDIAPPLDVFPWPLWMIICALLAALALAALIVWLLVRMARNRPQTPPPSLRALTLQELERLRAQVGQLAPYDFSIAVSDVLRKYIGAEFALHAQEQTSPEFLAAIASSSKFTADDRALLARFLERCDMIKFARIDATSEDSGELLGSASSFVQGVRA